MTYAITGLPSSYRAPLTAFELIFGQGASNAPTGPRAAHYVVKKTSAGSATVGTRYPITSEDQAITLFGIGSDGHITARTHIRKNPRGKLYMTAYAASSGDGSAAATETIVFATTATGPGSCAVEVCGVEFDVVYQTGDTPTDSGEVLEAKINAAGLPVTAVNTAGSVAITARVAGASQNSIYMLRLVRAATSGSGTTVTVTAAYLTAGADGTVTELANFSAALALLTAAPDYYFITPVVVSTFVAALKTFVTNRSAPAAGLRSRGFYPNTGALGAATTIAVASNYERVECAWQRGASQTPQEIVAWYAASKQLEEQAQSRFNFDNYPANGFIKPAPNPADWPTHDSDLGDAVNAGISPIVSTDTGAYLAMSVTTRSKNSAGLLDDFRASEPHRVSILDEVAATVSANHQQTFANFAQSDDPRLPDGTVDTVALANITGRRTTPFLFHGWFLQQLEPFFDERLQDQAAWEAASDSRIDPQNNSRMQTTASGRTIDLHHQATFRISETTAN